ncbi:MAG: hydroxyacid dehydrogenase, partial [Rhodobacteraceae bacterium]|nr:hydroxyacid dehydrogenase [Paracoccaceae bacterium]
QVPRPPAMDSEWFVLIEAADAPAAQVPARLESVLESALEGGLATDALVAQNEGQRAVFWGLRESIPAANRLIGAISSHDISLPPSRLVEFVERGRAAVAGIDPALRINCFGHLGDGNLHYNVFPPPGQPKGAYDPIREAVKTTVHDLAASLGGSVGAEHGVGRLKTGDLLRYGDPGSVLAMRRIKNALDPQGILNPGAVLAEP